MPMWDGLGIKAGLVYVSIVTYRFDIARVLELSFDVTYQKIE